MRLVDAVYLKISEYVKEYECVGKFKRSAAYDNHHNDKKQNGYVIDNLWDLRRIEYFVAGIF